MADTKKKVTFDRKIVVVEIRAWKYAYHAARIGKWQEAAVDRLRFQKRIAESADKIATILCNEHRLKIYEKLYVKYVDK